MSASPGRRTFSACLGAEVRRLPPRSRQASHRSKLRRRKHTLPTPIARLGSLSPNLAPSPSAGGGGGRAGRRGNARARPARVLAMFEAQALAPSLVAFVIERI